MVRLGIDIGTTSIKCCLILDSNPTSTSSSSNQRALHSQYVHKADVITTDNKHEQSVEHIFTAIRAALSELSRQEESVLLNISHISVCCQMHGIVFWNCANDFSNLISWQDGRCDEEFLARIRCCSEQSRDLHTGYGSATLAWFAYFAPSELSKYRYCGSIADFFVFVLCGLSDAVISDHNAQSWGFLDEVSGDWDVGAFQRARINISLPRVVRSGTIIGSVKDKSFCVNPGAQVFVPIGDLQASVYAVLGGAGGRVFNYGTASQIVQTCDPVLFPVLPATVRRTLYTRNHHLVTAASLNGGNAVNLVFNLFSSLSPDLNYDSIMELAYENRNTDLRVCPRFRGERHDTQTLGSFQNITSENFTIGNISAAVFRGVVENLCEMMEGVLENGSTLYAVGIAERPILKYYVQDLLGDYVLHDKEVTAAFGAVMFDIGNGL